MLCIPKEQGNGQKHLTLAVQTSCWHSWLDPQALEVAGDARNVEDGLLAAHSRSWRSLVLPFSFRSVGKALVPLDSSLDKRLKRLCPLEIGVIYNGS